LQRRHIEQAPSVAQLGEHIHIAPWPLVASGDRPEDAQPACAVIRCDASDLIAPFAQFFETRRRASRTGIRIRRTATLDLSAAIS
jgi:hypothetical protein